MGLIGFIMGAIIISMYNNAPSHPTLIQQHNTQQNTIKSDNKYESIIMQSKRKSLIINNNKRNCSSPCPIIFIHIQKTGGGTAKFYLRRNNLLTNRHPYHYDALHAKEYYSEEVWNKSCKLTFVRNPYARLVSWYSMWTNDPSTRGQGMTDILQQCGCNPDCSFSHFIKYCNIRAETKIGIKHISRSQLDYITDNNGSIMVDYIGRTENLGGDFIQFLKETCNFNSTIDHRMFRGKLGRMHMGMHDDFHKYYSDEIYNIVTNWAARDLEIFNYSFEQHSERF